MRICFWKDMREKLSDYSIPILNESILKYFVISLSTIFRC